MVFARDSASFPNMRGCLEIPWIRELEKTRRGCFFYTTEEEFLSVSIDYIKEGTQNINERVIWILPPQHTIRMAMGFLEGAFGREAESLIRMKRLMLLQWNSWFGRELEPKRVMQRGIKYAKEAYQEGFEGIRFLSHAPSKYSESWGGFLEFQNSLRGRTEKLPYLSFTAYSLMDCPVTAIASIAEDHDLCLIHYGSKWEWLRTDSGLRTLGGPHLNPLPQFF